MKARKYLWDGEIRTIDQIAVLMNVSSSTARQYVRRYRRSADVPKTGAGRPRNLEAPLKAVAAYQEGEAVYFLKTVSRTNLVLRYPAIVRKPLFTKVRVEWRDKEGVAHVSSVPPNRLEKRAV